MVNWYSSRPQLPWVLGLFQNQITNTQWGKGVFCLHLTTLDYPVVQVNRQAPLVVSGNERPKKGHLILGLKTKRHSRRSRRLGRSLPQNPIYWCIQMQIPVTGKNKQTPSQLPWSWTVFKPNKQKTAKFSIPTLFLICSSFSRENWYPLLICSSAAQNINCPKKIGKTTLQLLDSIYEPIYLQNHVCHGQKSLYWGWSSHL